MKRTNNKKEKKEKKDKRKNIAKSVNSSLITNRVITSKVFSSEEMDKVFAMSDSIEAKQDNKDYTIIRQENGKISELNRYKFEYDLLIWKKFYEKCHELDDSFFIQDDNLEKAIRNKQVPEDLTIRDIKYRRQNKTYSDKLVEEYEMKNYDEYAKSTVGSEHEVEEIIKKNRYGLLVIAIVLVLLGVGLYFVPMSFITDTVKIAICALLMALGLVSLLFFIFKKKEFKIRKYQAKIKPQLSFKEWQSKNCVSEEYLNKTDNMRKEYIDALKVKEDKVLSNVASMIEIKNRMMNVIPIHKDFYTEEGINTILNVVQARKCDTVRKALKFVKNKEYQVDYLSSTELLVRGMNYIEDSKIYIEEYNNLEYDLKKEFDRAIEKNNKILEYLESISFEKDSVISEQFFN